MLSSGLRSWQQQNNFRVGDDNVYGVHDNVGFSVAEEDGGKLFIFMLSGKDQAFDMMEDLLCTQSDELHLAQVGDVESYLALFFDDADGGISPDGMTALLDFVSGNYRTCGFRIPNVCVKCGAHATKRAYVGGMVQPLCAPCREADKLEKAHKAASPAASDRRDDRRSDPYDAPYDDERAYRDARRGERSRDRDDRYDREPRDRGGWGDDGEGWGGKGGKGGWNDPDAADPSSGEGSAPSGFFGAFLGALAGLAPYLLSVTLGFQLAALCFLSGIGAIIGYIAFGGLKAKKNALTTCIACSELLSIVAVLFIAGVGNMQDGASVMFKSLFSLSWLNLLMCTIGSLLGVMVCLDSLYKYLLRGVRR